MATSTINQKSGHHHFFVRKLIIYTLIYFDPCDQLPPWTYYVKLVYDVWLFDVHSPLFTMWISFYLLNWLFTSKVGNCIDDFIVFPMYCSDVQGQITVLKINILLLLVSWLLQCGSRQSGYLLWWLQHYCLKFALI